MKQLKTLGMSPLLILGIYLMIPVSNAHAYLDPGTTSMALQMIVGGVVGGLMAIKLFWKRLKEFTLRIFKK